MDIIHFMSLNHEKVVFLRIGLLNDNLNLTILPDLRRRRSCFRFEERAIQKGRRCEEEFEEEE